MLSIIKSYPRLIKLPKVCRHSSIKLKTKMPEPVAAPTEAVVPPPTGAGDKPKLKPCCACPETKKARDMCIVENGEAACGDFIEAHKDCMRKMGFNI